jgi:hypothetical protein
MPKFWHVMGVSSLSDASLNQNSENKSHGLFSFAECEDDLLHRNLDLLNVVSARQCYE